MEYTIKYEFNDPPCYGCVEYMVKVLTLQQEIENLNSEIIALQGQLVEKQRKVIREKEFLIKCNDDDHATKNNIPAKAHECNSECSDGTNI
jgi:hypothetical protein